MLRHNRTNNKLKFLRLEDGGFNHQWDNQGHDAQALAGHTNRHMTDHYKQGHDVVQWTSVSLETLNS